MKPFDKDKGKLYLTEYKHRYLISKCIKKRGRILYIGERDVLELMKVQLENCQHWCVTLSAATMTSECNETPQETYGKKSSSNEETLNEGIEQDTVTTNCFECTQETTEKTSTYHHIETLSDAINQGNATPDCPRYSVKDTLQETSGETVPHYHETLNEVTEQRNTTYECSEYSVQKTSQETSGNTLLHNQETVTHEYSGNTSEETPQEMSRKISLYNEDTLSSEGDVIPERSYYEPEERLPERSEQELADDEETLNQAIKPNNATLDSLKCSLQEPLLETFETTFSYSKETLNEPVEQSTVTVDCSSYSHQTTPQKSLSREFVSNEEILNKAIDPLNSDDEPQDEPFEDSGDEYIPSDSSLSSQSTPIKSLAQVRKALFLEPSKNLIQSSEASTSALPTSIINCHTESSDSSDCAEITTTGILKVYNGNATLKLKSVLHAGRLKCHLTTADSGYLAIISSRPAPVHDCVSAKSPDCIYIRDADKSSIELSANCCVFPGVFTGTEHQMDNNKFAASLQNHPCKKKNGKKNCCIYCKAMRKHMTDHLKKVHPHEPEVKKALALPPKSEEKNKIFSILRNKGNCAYNKQVKLEDRIPTRQPQRSKISEFVTCQHCHKLIAPSNFAKHNRKCTNRPPNYRYVTREAKNELIHTSKVHSSLINELLHPLKDDEISHIVRCDTALLAYAKHYAVSGNMRESKGKNIRMQLRLLARLFQEIQTLDISVLDFEDVLQPQKYDIIIQAVMLLTRTDFTSGFISKSSTCLLLKSCIKNLAQALKLHYLQLPKELLNYAKIKTLDEFISVHDCKYKEDVSKIAYDSRANERAAKNLKLPTTLDVKKFTDYVENIAETSYKLLKQSGFKYKHWLNLGTSVLILLLVFNRRRIGETSKMRLELYHQREKVHDEDRKYMNRLELLLSDRFSVMKLVAKRVRQLTVLLTEQHIKYLDTFLEHRTNAGVPEDNPFLFGVPSNIRYIDASHAIRKCSERCGAEEPHTLRATLLRKQVATLSQMLQLTDNEIQQLADFMGHKVEVHKKYYRNPSAVQEVTVLSKFFMAVGENDIGRFRGKSLSEIEVIVNQEDLPEEDVEGNSNDTENETCSQNLMEVDTHFTNSAEQRPTTSSTTIEKIVQKTPQKLPETTPQNTPPKTPAHTLEHLLNYTVRKTPRRVIFSKQEKDLIYKYVGRYIDSGEYPPQQMQLYATMLRDNFQIFHKKRTIRHIYSFVQYRIKCNRQKEK